MEHSILVLFHDFHFILSSLRMSTASPLGLVRSVCGESILRSSLKAQEQPMLGALCSLEMGCHLTPSLEACSAGGGCWVPTYPLKQNDIPEPGVLSTSGLEVMLHPDEAVSQNFSLVACRVANKEIFPREFLGEAGNRIFLPPAHQQHWQHLQNSQ